MPRTIIIRGKRLTTKAQLEANPRAMRDIAQELIELADFELTCVAKIIRIQQAFELSTLPDPDTEGRWTMIVGALWVDEEPVGRRVEVIEL